MQATLTSYGNRACNGKVQNRAPSPTTPTERQVMQVIAELTACTKVSVAERLETLTRGTRLRMQSTILFVLESMFRRRINVPDAENTTIGAVLDCLC